ncbi:uncharacterized protein LOC123557723 [Mercenaria mercenaria]|uniref:uncharacterized protein LOC123557723 n=1 Tax=Mercenaria mercenaria TaxID=6596 RepID=UPI00234F5556|nr:uncharacterized protein LOC123557723 [Mercenaria mercenaria]
MVGKDNNLFQCPFDLPSAVESARLNPVIEKYELALLMLLGFAGFSVLIGIAYNKIRHYVFRDFHSLDVVFDAGGRVSVSLTAVTLTSQLLWPSDILQSPTIANKVGVAGSLFYTLGIVLAVIVFSVLCIHLKTRAPGAKTFPQIAYARFGGGVQIMFCVVALFTNFGIIANIIFAGKATIDVLAKDTSTEFILFSLAVLFGSYCLIGGLGTTFYISYFNTALIFIITSLFILKVSYLVEPEVEAFTSVKSLHNTMACLKGPEGNYGNSFLTFRSVPGMIFGIITFLLAISLSFCDQANWQSRIAAKPLEGMSGFLIAAFLWVAIPTSISFVTSMAYKTMSFRNGTNLLTDLEIDEGYITPYVIQTLLGKEGCYVLLTLVTMTLMSTGSGEVMAISSILVYDIFKVHIKPFRSNTKPTDCDLCGKSKIPVSSGNIQTQLCKCVTSLECDLCGQDVKDRLAGHLEPGFKYKCPIHGKFRHYEDQLLQYKSWCMVGVIAAIIPYGLIIIESGMNLNWVFFATPVFTCPFLMPLYFTISWTGATAKGLVIGSITGLVSAVVGMMACGSTYEGGLSNFYTNTTQDYSLLFGFIPGFIVSTLISVIVSLCDNKSKDKVVFNEDFITEHSEDQIWDKLKTKSKGPEVEWLKTMSIDNPLNTYRRIYRKEFAAINAGRILTPLHMEHVFGRTKRVSTIGVIISLAIFLFIIPSVAASQEILTENQLRSWLSVCHHWCLIATVFVVIIPPIQEGLQIWRQYKRNKRFIVKHSSEISLTITQQQN